MEAAGSVDALMDTEAAGLPQREQEALVDVCNKQHVIIFNV